jgi:tetratricopeptide (TPR) repeat protein
MDKSKLDPEVLSGSTTSNQMNSRVAILFVCVFLVGINWLVFGQTLSHPFINFDDPEYVIENPEIITGLTAHGVVWAFTHEHGGNWHPLTSISHMLDYQTFGSKAGGHHFTNVLLHTVAVILLFLALREMTGSLWRSAFVATLFAIHPLRVESVAWIAERKDVLSGVFFMLTLAAYARYVRKPSIGGYLIVILVFIFGLMSKPMLVTMPLLLLLLDYWPLRRPARSSLASSKAKLPVWWERLTLWQHLVLEKIPLLALSVASCITTLLVQKPGISSFENLPLSWRINNAFASYVAYMWQMLCPIRLALFYPHPQNRLRFLEVALAVALLAGITAVAFSLRGKRPYVLTGWLWYVGMLVPVVGIVQVGRQSHADRYTYLPQIGLYLLAAWGIADLSVRWPYRRQIVSGVATIVISLLAWDAWIQTRYWRDSESLWTHTIAVTSNNDFAHASLADLLLRRGRVPEAISHAQVALTIWPDNADAHNNLALALFRTGHIDEAIAHWKKSLEIRPGHMNAQSNLAWVLATSPDPSLRDGAKAVELAEKVIQLAGHPNAMILRTLAAGYAESGKFSDAIDIAHRALQLAVAQGNAPLAQDLQLNIANYRQNLPLRDPGLISASPPR